MIKTFFKIIAWILVLVILTVGGYAAYLLLDYERIENNVEISVRHGDAIKPEAGMEYKLISYNIGFAAYTSDFGFFMDGGSESRAFSKQSVLDTMSGIISVLKEEDADFMMIEEVDEDATRSYYVNERSLLESAFSDGAAAFAVNYDSSYLFYPFSAPHGKSLSGMLTLSRFDMTESVRRSLPIEESLMKFVDLDRCYSVSRVEVSNGRELVLYTAHLSAYTSDGLIAEEQLRMLLDDMESEYNNGNYCICGGDFNKDLLGDSSKIFGISSDGYTWAQPFPESMVSGRPLAMIAPFDENNPIPSCRNADGPHNPGQFVVTVDGFIASDNIEIVSSRVIDTGFVYSDHNPVELRFVMK